MLSILFLASAVNANSHLSIPKKFMTTTQQLSSQLRTVTLNYARKHARRLMEEDTACVWDNDNSKCNLSPHFIANTAANDGHASVKQLVAKSIACSKKEQAACIGDCEYKSGKCDVSEKVSGELLQSVFKDGADSCGPMATMLEGDECTSITSETACTDKCEWHKSGDYELDETDNTCKEVSECKTKPDPQDPFGMNKMCPNMEAVKAECEGKGDEKAVMDCFGAKCPMMLMFMGAMGCGTSTTEDKCNSLGELCDWKTVEGTEKCEMNMDYVLDLLIPDGCFLKPLLVESMQCGQEKSATTCAGTGKCKWEKKFECEKAGAPETKEECASDGQSFMTALLGDHAVRQQAACQKTTSMSTCTSVEAVPDPTQASTGTSATLTVLLTVFVGVAA